MCSTLGLLYMQIGENAMAFEQLGTALAFDPSNAKAMMAAGSMMQSHGDFDVALAKYRLVIIYFRGRVPLLRGKKLSSSDFNCFLGKFILIVLLRGKSSLS